jgi:TonB-linked SusC/RagA family outer membrane protein
MYHFNQFMNLRIYLTIGLIFCSVAWALAQDREISGRVIDQEKMPIYSASILLKGTSRGALTDFDGKFKLKIPVGTNQVLLFRSIGYKSKEVPVTEKDVYNITLEEETTELGAVTITAYGKPERKVDKVTNSTNISFESIKNVQAPSFDAALQGRSTGMQVVQSSGIAGAGTTIRIRGTSSITAASDPLVVVDGIPIVTGAGGDGAVGIGGGLNVGFQSNALASINPSDIENIEVLKDAAACARFGARGSNGVILVTTKKGKAGKTNFNFNFSRGVIQETNRIRMLNGPEYLQVLDSAYKNSWMSNRRNADPNLGRRIPNRQNYLTFPLLVGLSDSLAQKTNNDWLDILLRPAAITDASLSASGGNQKTQYFISGSYLNQEGVMRGNDFTRFGGRFNLTNTATDKLQVGIKAYIGYSINNQTPSGFVEGGAQGGFGAAQFRSLPIFPIYWTEENQQFNTPPTSFNPFFNAYGNFAGSNIVLTQDRNYAQYREEQFRNTTNVFAEYKLLPRLSYRVDYGLDLFNQINFNYLSRYLRVSSIDRNLPTGQIVDSRVFFNNQSLNNTFNYEIDFDEKSNLTASLVQNYQRTISYNNAVSGERLENDFTRSVSQTFRQINPRSGNQSEFAFLSVMALANYKYKERYLAQASIRTDGSSRFGPNNRYGWFPSLGAGWIISEEDRIKEIQAISFLKLTTSFGLTGNAAGLDNFQWFGLYGPGATYNLNPGVRPKQILNDRLTWEKAYQVDGKIEYGLLGDKITGALGYFNKTSYNLILGLPFAPSAGIQGNFVTNVGRMRNSGLEVELGYKAGKDNSIIKYSGDLNVTFQKNKLLDIGGLQFNEISGSLDIGSFIGQQISSFYLPVWAGVDPNSGEELIYRAERDANGELTGRLTNETFRPVNVAQIDSNRVPQFDKPIIPKIFGGFNNKFTLFKNLEVTLFFTYQFGNYILDQGERRQSYFTGANNLRATALNAWSPSNPNSNFPKLYYSNAPQVYNAVQGDTVPQFPYTTNDPMQFRNTTRFLHNGSFVRLKSLSVGYNIPREFLTRWKMTSMRVFINATNLLTFTKYPGWDPEVSGNLNNNVDRNLRQGITDLDFPQVKTVVAGVNIGF